MPHGVLYALTEHHTLRRKVLMGRIAFHDCLRCLFTMPEPFEMCGSCGTTKPMSVMHSGTPRPGDCPAQVARFASVGSRSKHRNPMSFKPALCGILVL